MGSSIQSREIVRGMIFMWNGTIATIPGGFALCNGSNGTPDLRNRFIVCADADSGGAAKTTVSGSATQSGGAATKTLDVTEIPAHTHSYSGQTTPGASGTGSDGEIAPGSETTGSTGGGTAFSILNPYYALAFIMKL